MNAPGRRLDQPRRQVVALAEQLLCVAPGTRAVFVVLKPATDEGFDTDLAAYCEDTDLVTAALYLLTTARRRFDPACETCAPTIAAIDEALAAFPGTSIQHLETRQ